MRDSDGGVESATDRTTRRSALRTVAGLGATGLLTSLAGCEEAAKQLKPAGQTVVYKTPGGDLREGSMSAEILDETETPETKPVVDVERSVASIGTTTGRLSLSPDASEVAYLETKTNSSDWGTAVGIEALNGGDERHSASDLQRYWSSTLGSLKTGSLLALDWCPASGSDKLVLVVDGRGEMNGQLLFTFDRGKTEVKLLEGTHTPNKGWPNVAWSPSCDKIAYREEPASGKLASDAPLTALTVSTEKNTRRTQSGSDPAWGDTGIAFVRDGNVYLDRQSGTVQLTSSSSTDSNPVIFDQQPGESLAFRRNDEIRLIQRIDQFGSNPNPSSRKVETDEKVATFDIRE